MNLIRLGRITGRHDYLEKAEAMHTEFSSQLAAYPAGYTQLLIAVDLTLNPSHEVVIVGSHDATDTQAMLSALHRTYLPHKVVILRPATDNLASEVIGLAPYTRSMRAINGRATSLCVQAIHMQSSHNQRGQNDGIADEPEESFRRTGHVIAFSCPIIGNILKSNVYNDIYKV